MARRKTLSPRQVEAGRRLWSAYTLGVMGLRGGDAGHNCRVPVAWMEAKVAAERDYRGARDALGLRLWPVAWGVVCADQSVHEYSLHHDLNAVATAAVLRIALDILADHYGIAEDA